MKQESFEKSCKDIIMLASQTILAKQGDMLAGQAKVEGFKQTSNFTGKPVTEVAFMQMMEYLDKIKDMCLSGKEYPAEDWKDVLTNNIVYSSILYAINSEPKTGSNESEDVEDKK